MKVRERLNEAAGRLAGVSATPRLDTELLMAHALGTSREEMLLSRMDDAAPAAFEPLLDRRLRHEPVAYVTGHRAFWTIELEVGPDVLIPRPDSETLIEAAVAHFRGRAGPRRILDLGTGSGALLLAALAEWPDASGLGIDCSEGALAVAARNAQRLGLEDRAGFRPGVWTDGLAGPFDLILCNPPYVETGAELPPEVADWEPGTALYAGADGLEAYRRLAPALPPLLSPGGVACLELGAGQAERAARLFEAEGFSVASRHDLQGVDRCLILTR